MNQNPQHPLGIINFITGIFDGFILSSMTCILAFPFFKDTPIFIPLTGFIVSILGALIYGFSRYFGEINEIEHHHPELSKAEIEKEYALLKHIGIEDQLNDEMQLKMEEERILWLNEVVEYNLGWETENKERAKKSGFQTGLGFLSAGLISVICVFLMLPFSDFNEFPLKEALLFWIIPLLLLFIFGGIKARYLGKSFWKGSFRSTAYGIVMFGIAIFVALFIIKIKS